MQVVNTKKFEIISSGSTIDNVDCVEVINLVTSKKSGKGKKVWRRKFTLIEILLTTVIAALVIMFAIGGYSFAIRRSKEAATKSTIMKLELVLNELHKKYGVYPNTNTDTDNYNLIIDLSSSDGKINDIDESKVKNYVSDFMKLIDFSNLSVAKNGDKYTVVDAWEVPMRYIAPGKIRIDSFDIISSGNDKVLGYSGDANNYTYVTFDDDNNNDDIANFNLSK